MLAPVFGRRDDDGKATHAGGRCRYQVGKAKTKSIAENHPEIDWIEHGGDLTAGMDAPGKHAEIGHHRDKAARRTGTRVVENVSKERQGEAAIDADHEKRQMRARVPKRGDQ